jgi:hypothetical protein
VPSAPTLFVKTRYSFFITPQTLSWRTFQTWYTTIGLGKALAERLVSKGWASSLSLSLSFSPSPPTAPLSAINWTRWRFFFPEKQNFVWSIGLRKPCWRYFFATVYSWPIVFLYPYFFFFFVLVPRSSWETLTWRMDSVSPMNWTMGKSKRKGQNLASLFFFSRIDKTSNFA